MKRLSPSALGAVLILALVANDGSAQSERTHRDVWLGANDSQRAAMILGADIGVRAGIVLGLSEGAASEQGDESPQEEASQSPEELVEWYRAALPPSDLVQEAITKLYLDPRNTCVSLHSAIPLEMIDRPLMTGFDTQTADQQVEEYLSKSRMDAVGCAAPPDPN